MGRGTQRRVRISELLEQAQAGASAEVTGWIKTARFSKNVSFAHVFDGSTPETVQVVLEAEDAERLKNDLGIGTAVRIQGKWQDSPGGKQDFEVLAETDMALKGSKRPGGAVLEGAILAMTR